MGQIILFRKGNSGEIAGMRLKLLLASDRAHISSGILEQIRDDMIGILSRYAEIDVGQVTMRVKRPEDPGGSGMTPLLCVSLPLRQKYASQT
ncbi:MAG: cell division topological specificity factor MinE [Clostridiales bacterium]|nr:cell division topological specificity factor MinE [Clostridiales bacterium]